MRFMDRVRQSLTAVGQSFSRFSLTYFFLLMATMMGGLLIEDSQESYVRYFFTFFVDAMITAVGQIIYERFFTSQPRRRYILMAAAILLTIAYYFILSPITVYHLEFPVKTSVILFALIIAFIWITTIRNHLLAFHQNLLAVFKAVFTSLLFGAILTLGMFTVISAIDSLLFNLDDDLFTHSANIIWVFLSPIYTLSLVPGYSDQAVQDKPQGFTIPRFFEVLLSYVVIPLTIIYTVILIVYIIINITDQFWTDNLLEPLLVTYAIVSLIVYLLSFNLDNKYVQLYQQIFPKILVPIVLFQTFASTLRTQEMGLTHGRYFVILFGVFATITAVLFSLNKVKFHGWASLILLVFSIISITPPIDAFTVSRNNHIRQLKAVLEANQMLVDGQIIANSNISQEYKVAITQLVDYIDRMEYDNYLDFIPEKFDYYRQFDEVFGFNRTYAESSFEEEVFNEYVVWNWIENPVIDIGGYQKVIRLYIYNTEESLDRIDIEHDGKTYHMDRDFSDDYLQLSFTHEDGQEILTYDTREIFDHIFNEDFVYDPLGYELSPEEALITVESDALKLDILVLYLNRTTNYIDGEIYLFLTFV